MWFCFFLFIVFLLLVFFFLFFEEMTIHKAADKDKIWTTSFGMCVCEHVGVCVCAVYVIVYVYIDVCVHIYMFVNVRACVFMIHDGEAVHWFACDLPGLMTTNMTKMFRKVLVG
jgi:hypothetical protein